jgi:hypothetical protein
MSSIGGDFSGTPKKSNGRSSSSDEALFSPFGRAASMRALTFPPAPPLQPKERQTSKFPTVIHSDLLRKKAVVRD